MSRLILIGTVFVGTVVVLGALLWAAGEVGQRFGEWYEAALEVDL